MVSFVSSDVTAVSNLMKLSAHDYYTYNHCVDVAVYSIVLAKKIHGSDNKQLLIQAGLGGLLHDIGKRRIDFNIINKNGKLNAEEWALVQRHPEFGVEYLTGQPSIPDESIKVVEQHHENFDGTGYPKKLSGNQITALARLTSIADVFDALTTKRSYHKPLSPTDALALMQSMQPGKFDPALFGSFELKMSRGPGVTIASDFDACQPQRQKLVRS